MRRERFATHRGAIDAFPYVLGSYRLPFVDYPGQDAAAAAKRENQRLLAAAVDGVVIRPAETWSLWRLAGRPASERGYAPAAAVRDGVLTLEVGGATCLLSTVVYNAALLAGLEIRERSQHSLDTYGDRRYFELGRDAAIEYGYLDLRFSNPHAIPVCVRVTADDTGVAAAVHAAGPRWFSTEIEVAPVAPPPGEREQIVVHTMRRVVQGPNESVEDLGLSCYVVAPVLPARDR